MVATIVARGCGVCDTSSAECERKSSRNGGYRKATNLHAEISLSQMAGISMFHRGGEPGCSVSLPTLSC